jgi:hypothetical protein
MSSNIPNVQVIRFSPQMIETIWQTINLPKATHPRKDTLYETSNETSVVLSSQSRFLIARPRTHTISPDLIPKVIVGDRQKFLASIRPALPEETIALQPSLHRASSAVAEKAMSELGRYLEPVTDDFSGMIIGFRILLHPSGAAHLAVGSDLSSSLPLSSSKLSFQSGSPDEK